MNQVAFLLNLIVSLSIFLKQERLKNLHYFVAIRRNTAKLTERNTTRPSFIYLGTLNCEYSRMSGPIKVSVQFILGSLTWQI